MKYRDLILENNVGAIDRIIAAIRKEETNQYPQYSFKYIDPESIKAQFIKLDPSTSKVEALHLFKLLVGFKKPSERNVNYLVNCYNRYLRLKNKNRIKKSILEFRNIYKFEDYLDKYDTVFINIDNGRVEFRGVITSSTYYIEKALSHRRIEDYTPPFPRVAFVNFLSVHPDNAKKGIGKSVIKGFVDRVKKEHGEVIYACPRPYDRSLLDKYEQWYINCGFERTGVFATEDNRELLMFKVK